MRFKHLSLEDIRQRKIGLARRKKYALDDRNNTFSFMGPWFRLCRRKPRIFGSSAFARGGSGAHIAACKRQSA